MREHAEIADPPALAGWRPCRVGEGMAWMFGRLNLACGCLNLLLMLGFLVVRGYRIQLSPNPQGLVFSVVVELGRLVDLLDLASVVGAPHRRRVLVLLTNNLTADQYLAALALAHGLLAASNLVLSHGFRHLQRWARWFQVALAVGGAATMATARVLAGPEPGLGGAAIACVPALLVIAALMSRPIRRVFAPSYRAAKGPTPAQPPPLALALLVLGLTIVPVGLIWLDYSTIQLALTIKQLLG